MDIPEIHRRLAAALTRPWPNQLIRLRPVATNEHSGTRVRKTLTRAIAVMICVALIGAGWMSVLG